MTQEALLTLCSPQKPMASEARPKFVGTGLPAKPVLLRSARSLWPLPLWPRPQGPHQAVAAPFCLRAGLLQKAVMSYCSRASQDGDGEGGLTCPYTMPCHSLALPGAGPVLDPQLGSLPATHTADQGHCQAASAAAGAQPGGLRSAHPTQPSWPSCVTASCVPVCWAPAAPCPAAFRERLFTQVVQMRCPCQGQRRPDSSLGVVCDPMPVSGPLGVIVYSDGGEEVLGGTVWL